MSGPGFMFRCLRKMTVSTITGDYYTLDLVVDYVPLNAHEPAAFTVYVCKEIYDGAHIGQNFGLAAAPEAANE